MIQRPHLKAGLARAEVLFLLSVALLMVSLGAPLGIEWRNHQHTKRVYRELRVLVSAADQYNREYRLWPAPDASGRGDIRLGLSRGNGDVIRVLLGEDGAGNEAHRGNPAKLNFFALVNAPEAASTLRRNKNGDVLDPWGRPYQMVFDTDYDSICTIPESSYSAVIGEGVVIWSMGPDRRPDTIDDLRSWTL